MRPARQNPVDQRRGRRAHQAVCRVQRTRRGGLRRQPHPRMGRPRRDAARVAVLYRSNAQSRVFEEAFSERAHAVSGVRRPALLRARRDQGRARVSAPGRKPRGRHVVRTRGQPADPRHRRQDHGSVRDSAARTARRCGWRRSACCRAGFRSAPRRRCRLSALIERLTHGSRRHGSARAGRSRHSDERPDRALQEREGRTRRRTHREPAGARQRGPRLFTGRARRTLPPLESFLAHAVLESGEGQADPYGTIACR